jgi:hypothetical protein
MKLDDYLFLISVLSQLTKDISLFISPSYILMDFLVEATMLFYKVSFEKRWTR